MNNFKNSIIALEVIIGLVSVAPAFAGPDVVAMSATTVSQSAGPVALTRAQVRATLIRSEAEGTLPDAVDLERSPGGAVHHYVEPSRKAMLLRTADALTGVQPQVASNSR